MRMVFGNSAISNLLVASVLLIGSRPVAAEQIQIKNLQSSYFIPTTDPSSAKNSISFFKTEAEFENDFPKKIYLKLPFEVTGRPPTTIEYVALPQNDGSGLHSYLAAGGGYEGETYKNLACSTTLHSKSLSCILIWPANKAPISFNSYSEGLSQSNPSILKSDFMPKFRAMLDFSDGGLGVLTLQLH